MFFGDDLLGQCEKVGDWLWRFTLRMGN
jgi:hypothetical protein